MNSRRKPLVQVVVGAQYGSEAKGHIASHLAKPHNNTTVLSVRVAGPNAGHSVVDRAGRKWKLRQIPTAAISNPDALLYIAPGSEIDPDVLLSEVNDLDHAGFGVSARLTISPSVTVIMASHRDIEKAQALNQRLGSTQTGVGAARAERIMRRAPVLINHIVTDTLRERGVQIHNIDYRGFYHVVVEGTQGYALGLHTSYYPFCTSSDCRAIDFLSMAGLSPWDWKVEVWMVARTYPIRVAGNSGPMRNETSWEELGIAPETTTVTRRVRRVGQWDTELVRKAINANGGANCANVKLALTMVDYILPNTAGHTEKTIPTGAASDLVKLATLMRDTGKEPTLFGTSPHTVVDWRS